MIENDTLTLRCTHSGGSSAQTSFRFFEGEPKSWTTWSSWADDHSSSQQTTIKRSDAGPFGCQGRNIAGSGDADTFQLTVHCRLTL